MSVSPPDREKRRVRRRSRGSESRCSKCRRDLPVDEFAVDRSKASRRKSWCKACDREKARAYYERNRIEVIRRVSAYNTRRRKAA